MSPSSSFREKDSWGWKSHSTLADTEWFRMSTTGNRMGTVSRSGSMCVEMKARDVKMVAAHRRSSLVHVRELCQTVCGVMPLGHVGH
jgi:hypothetical protein